MTVSFYEQLNQETAAERMDFQSIPVIRRALAEGAGRELYLAFLNSAYHHVKYTCPLLGRALSLLGEDDRAYRAGLVAYIDEEKGHEEWILDDIEALGGDAQASRLALAPLAVRVMIAYAYYAIDHLSPYALLGMVHVLEGMSVALACAAAASIKAGLGIGAKEGGGGFSYLTSHGDLDQDHVRSFADLLADIDSPQRRVVVIQAARVFYTLYGDVFRSLEQGREVSDVACR
jgi:heme oxygenase